MHRVDDDVAPRVAVVGDERVVFDHAGGRAAPPRELMLDWASTTVPSEVTAPS